MQDVGHGSVVAGTPYSVGVSGKSYVQEASTSESNHAALQFRDSGKARAARSKASHHTRAGYIGWPALFQAVLKSAILFPSASIRCR
jgi:hypothetical protein